MFAAISEAFSLTREEKERLTADTLAAPRCVLPGEDDTPRRIDSRLLGEGESGKRLLANGEVWCVPQFRYRMPTEVIGYLTNVGWIPFSEETMSGTP